MKKYGMIERGCSLGCQPDGFIMFEDVDKQQTGFYSILWYARELTQEEIDRYSLKEIKEEK